MKLKTKRCTATGDTLIQLDGNTIHGLKRKRDKIGTYYESDRFSGWHVKTIAEAKVKTEKAIRDGHLGDHFKTLLLIDRPERTRTPLLGSTSNP